MSIEPTAVRQIVGVHVKDIDWIIALRRRIWTRRRRKP